MKTFIFCCITLIGIAFATLINLQGGAAIVASRIPFNMGWAVHTCISAIVLGMFWSIAEGTYKRLRHRELSRAPGRRSQEPEGKVTWNSLTPEQKQRAYDIFGYTIVNDFSRTKGGHYPLHAAISYCIFYPTVAEEYKSMDQHAATRLSLQYVDMILGHEEVEKRKFKEDTEDKMKKFLAAKEGLEKTIAKYKKNKPS